MRAFVEFKFIERTLISEIKNGSEHGGNYVKQS